MAYDSDGITVGLYSSGKDGNMVIEANYLEVNVRLMSC